MKIAIRGKFTIRLVELIEKYLNVKTIGSDEEIKNVTEKLQEGLSSLRNICNKFLAEALQP
jgi:hypothetical protein